MGGADYLEFSFYQTSGYMVTFKPFGISLLCGFLVNGTVAIVAWSGDVDEICFISVPPIVLL